MAARTVTLAAWACGFLAAASLHAQTHPDLGAISDYPTGSEVWLGSIVGEVTVSPEFPIEVSVQGPVEWKAADGETVAQDQVVCLTGARKIELTEQDLQLKKDRYQNALIDLEWSNRDKKKTLESTIREHEQKLSQMKLTPTEKSLLGDEFAQRLAVERTKLLDELERAQEKLRGDYFNQDLLNERMALDLEIEKSEHDLWELLRASEVRAAVSGKLVIESREMFRQDSPIGRIVKDNEAEARVELADPRLRDIPGKQLAIEILGEDGRTYRGTYSRLFERTSLDRNARIVIFQIQAKDEATGIPQSLSGNRMTRILRILPEPGHIVPKNKLIFQFPEEIHKDGWAAFIETRWPGVKVSYVGPKELVIIPAHEN